MSMKKIISLKNISKRFGGVKAVEDISLDLFESEVCGIVGHNGAGKTVLMNILSGVYNSDTIEILKRHNCIAGITTKACTADLDEDSYYELPRLNTNDFPQ